MSNKRTLEQQTVKEFVVLASDSSLARAKLSLAQSGAPYCIVTSPMGEVITLTTPEQLNALRQEVTHLSDSINLLPTAVVVESHQTINNVIEKLSAAVLKDGRTPGVVVLHRGRIEGIVPRAVIAAHAEQDVRRRGLRAGEIVGTPLNNPRPYVCPQCDYKVNVVFYDRNNPPRCPAHREKLILKG